MYKSLIGAIGLFGLLLLLCAANAPVVQAGALKQAMQVGTDVPVSQRNATDTVKATTFFTKGALYVENMAVQNQRILEVPVYLSAEIEKALGDISANQQILYRTNSRVGILATSPVDVTGKDIDSAVNLVQQPYQEIFEMADGPIAPPIANEMPLIIGNPHGVGAVPFGLPIGTGGNITNVMSNQWAFAQSTAGQFGIDLYDSLGITRLNKFAGHNTRIVFFDTSPFTFPVQSGQSLFTNIFTTPFQLLPFDRLKVKVTNITYTQPYINEHLIFHEELTGSVTLTDISSHGLFAAALAYAVAPAAEIELVQVLDSYGRGTTAELIKALDRMTATLVSTQPTIFNLSLGVLADHAPDDDDVQLLMQTISRTMEKGVIVVASAGNRLTNTESITMQLPAAYHDVIGVGASNATGGVACFSKYQKEAGYGVVAPGGEAAVEVIRREKSGEITKECKPTEAIKLCPLTAKSCAYTLTGIIRDPKTGDYQYAYWMGTSFAAPIVSGLIALELESGKTQEQIRQILEIPLPSPDNPAQVRPEGCPSSPIKHLVIRAGNVEAC